MARVGFILRPAADWASIAWYEYLIIDRYGVNVLHFEIKKEWVYERNYKVKVLVVHVILSQREQIDKILRDFKIGDRT